MKKIIALSCGRKNGNCETLVKEAAMGAEELGALSGVSPSHLGRIERGERFPSALVLRKIAGPLGLSEEELFAFAGFLSSPSADAETHTGRIDPYVAGMLASEPVFTQRGSGRHPQHLKEHCWEVRDKPGKGYKKRPGDFAPDPFAPVVL